MEWLIAGVLALGGVGAYGATRLRASQAEKHEHEADLQRVREVAEEDVTVFGDQLRRLGEALDGTELDAAAQQDYQTALDAYEHAKWNAPRMQSPDEISALIDTLATGRYSMVCVRARVAGEPVPEMRVPCFFNPQHGPSAQNKMWTSPRSGTRTVPVCTRCAAQLAAREKPEVRTITIGGRKVPYWEAGTSFHPYSRGYFPEGNASSSVVAWMYVTPDAYLGQGGYDAPSFGAHGSMDFGGFDSGGGDGAGPN